MKDIIFKIDDDWTAIIYEGFNGTIKLLIEKPVIPEKPKSNFKETYFFGVIDLFVKIHKYDFPEQIFPDLPKNIQNKIMQIMNDYVRASSLV